MAPGQKTERTPWGGSFEAYDRLRYFTITGKAVNTEGIDERQAQLDAIREELFPPAPAAGPLLRQQQDHAQRPGVA